MTAEELKAIEVRAATSQHGITQTEALALVAEVRRLAARSEALRTSHFVDGSIAEPDGDDAWLCELCSGIWKKGEPEKHGRGCVAAPEER